ncbi:OmpA family protein [Zhongshania guokunii]|uniref:OmpA family protein n=1 Tax=Zhongshania guokunii TaxID=641783 RepID=A0ABV3UDS1_9GAMM
MKFFYRRLSVFLCAIMLMGSPYASADALTELLNSLGLKQLFSEVGSTVGTVGASVLDPIGTGDNDFLGADILNPENDLGLTVMSGELAGFGNKTGTGTDVPLDAVGLSQLLSSLGLTYETGFAGEIRNAVGPDGMLTAEGVNLLNSITQELRLAGLPQGEGLALAGSDSGGLLGLSVLNSGSAGNDGAIGVAILSGANSGNGEYAGLSILSGANSGNASSLGAAILSGDNSGNSDAIAAGVLSGDKTGNGGSAGVAILNGANSGNGDSAGVAILNGDNSGNSDLAAAAVLNGANSGNSGTVAIAAINGENAGNGGVVAVGALNGPSSGSGGLIGVGIANGLGANNGESGGNDGSCAGSGAVGCSDALQLAMLDTCKDSDADGVCDERDECLDTPADMPVFLTGCHLTDDAPLVLRGVNFEFDKWDLTPESHSILEHAVKVLAAQPEALVAIDGHTDAKGSDAYNMRLSYRRANTVYNYLLAAGVDERRLAYRGYGEGVPVATNENEDGSDNPQGRAENRRVELNILDGETFDSVKQENRANP